MEEQTKVETTKTEDTEAPLDKNVRLMSPTRMVVRRFFRSRLSIIGLIMVVGLFLFSFVGPYFVADMPDEVVQTDANGNPILDENGDPIITYVYHENDGKWGEIELDKRGMTEYAVSETTYTVNGITYTLRQTTETKIEDNMLAPPSGDHILGTDNQGYDIFVRLMYGGRISLIVSFLAVFLITVLGVIMGGIAGYFGGVIDNIIMRLCDILICLPGIPILLIISTILDASDIDAKYRIYLLMIYLTFISWPGTARLVRGQILSLREQEFMTATEACGIRVSRRIFRHLIPNVIPQLIVFCTMGLGSTIITEATLSFLGLGVKFPFASWGNIINDVNDTFVMTEYLFIWVPAGICLLLTVLAFNLVGDGLRDAFDPKMKR